MGKVLRFKYSGGSHPGEYRTVYFADGTSGVGFDLDAEAVRSFLKLRMSDASELPCSVVNTAHLPKTIAASAIEAGWEAEGKTVVRNGNTLIGYVKPVKLVSTLESFNNGSQAGIRVAHGKRELHIYGQGYGKVTYGLHHYINGCSVANRPVKWNATPADLLESMQWVVNG